MEKSKYYVFVDYMRVILSFGIIALHVDAFRDINIYIDFWVTNILTRICVPIFFLISGFFAEPIINDRKRIFIYIKRLFKMYLFCSVLYLPLAYNKLNGGVKPIRTILLIVKNFIFIGTYQHLWYFVSLMWAVCFVHILISCKVNPKRLMIYLIVIYIIGVFGNAYFPVELCNSKIFKIYCKIFGTTRNGFFVGLPLVYIGQYIRKWMSNNHINKSKCLIGGFTSLAAMTIEALLVYEFFDQKSHDMLFSLMPTAVFIFLIIINKETKTLNRDLGIHIRKLSTLVFELHLIVDCALGIIYEKFNIRICSMLNFLLIVLITILISEIIILISEYKRVEWLKNMFT